MLSTRFHVRLITESVKSVSLKGLYSLSIFVGPPTFALMGSPATPTTPERSVFLNVVYTRFYYNIIMYFIHSFSVIGIYSLCELVWSVDDILTSCVLRTYELFIAARGLSVSVIKGVYTERRNWNELTRFSFLRAKAAILLSARLSLRSSVRLSVRLSHGWISQKRCKLESPNLHCRLPGRLQFQEP